MEEFIKSVAQLQDIGGSILGLAILGYILWTVLKNHQKNQEWFMGFVNENNHQKESMICEHTKALVEVKNSIQQNTETIKNLSEIMFKK